MIQARLCWERRRPRLLVTLHVPQLKPAGEDACAPSIARLNYSTDLLKVTTNHGGSK